MRTEDIADYLNILLVLGIFFLSVNTLKAQTKNGFDLSNALIPAEEVKSGGPPKDGIPSIDNPVFIEPEAADFLKRNERVLGLEHNGVAKAYPIKIMNWHEIVNDVFGDEPVVITYCPLCGSGVAYDARVAGKAREFGVSGLLYNNDVLLYDRDSESLWSQIMSKAVAGPLKGTELEVLPLQLTTWADWQSRYPDTQVLSDETGFRRNYNRDPYAGYEEQNQVMFPVSNTDDRYHKKELVLGVKIDGNYKAYPFSELEKTDGSIRDTFAGQELIINYSKMHDSATVSSMNGKEVPGITLYWFAWVAFHPDTEVFQASSS